MKKVHLSLILISFYFFMVSCSSSSKDGTTVSSSAESTLQAGAFGTVTDIKAVASKMTDGSGNWQVIFSWTNPATTTVLSYTIERSEKTNAIPTKTHKDDYTNIKASPYTIKSLPADSTQYFIVIATGTVDSTSVSVRSTEYSVKIPLDDYLQKPGAFTMTAVPGNGQVTIDWMDSERASFYIIQRGLTSQSYPTAVAKLASKPYVDSGLTNGQTYYYTVIAVNSIGNTNATDEAFAQPLSDPGSFTLTAVPGNGQVTLAWGSYAESRETTGYLVSRSTNPNPNLVARNSAMEGFFHITSTPLSPSTLTFVDTTSTNGTRYYYIISALGLQNKVVMARSNVAEAIPNPLPQAFTATATPGNTEVTLTWTSSEGASSYTVNYGTSATGPYPVTVSNAASSGLIIPGLTNGTPYYFQVIAVNGVGSINAPEVSATPTTSQVFTAIATPGDSQATLTWPIVSGATNYTISYSTNQGGPYNVPVSGPIESPQIITGLTNNTPYYFQVSAVTPSGTINAPEVSATPAYDPCAIYLGDVTFLTNRDKEGDPDPEVATFPISDLKTFNRLECKRIGNLTIADIVDERVSQDWNGDNIEDSYYFPNLYSIEFTHLEIVNSITMSGDTAWEETVNYLYFPSLKSVKNFSITTAGALNTISIPNTASLDLTSGDNFVISNNGDLDVVNLSGLKTITGSTIRIAESRITSLDISGLSSMSGNFDFEISNLAFIPSAINMSGLTTINASGSPSDKANFKIFNNAFYGHISHNFTINMSQLTSISGNNLYWNIENNGAEVCWSGQGCTNVGLRSIDLSNLTTINLSGASELHFTDLSNVFDSLSFPALATITGDLVLDAQGVNSHSNLTSVAFPALTTLSGSSAVININDNYSLSNIDFSSLVSIGDANAGSGRIYIDNNDLSTVSFGQLATIANNRSLVINNSYFSSLSFPSLSTLNGNLDLRYNYSLENLNFNSLTAAPGWIYVYDNSGNLTVDFGAGTDFSSQVDDVTP